MNYNGIAKGKVIELDQPLPYANGQPVRVSVEPLGSTRRVRSVDRLLEAMRSSPPVSPADVDAMLRAIEEGKLPLSEPPTFDDAA